MTPESIRKQLDRELKAAFPDQFVTSGYGLENAMVINIESEFTLMELDQLRDMVIKADQMLYEIEEGRG